MNKKSSRIYITGGKGFIASHLTRRLETINKEFEVINRNNSKDISLPNDKKNILFWAGEPSNIGQVNSSSYSEQLSLNKKYERVLKNNFDQVIFLSSIYVYKTDSGKSCYKEDDALVTSNNYSKGKISRERLTLNQKEGCVFRLSNVYGLGMKGNIFEDIKVQIFNSNEMVMVRNLNSIFDLIYIKDIVDCFIESIEKGLSGLYNLSTNRSTNPKEIINLIFKGLNIEKEIKETNPSNVNALIADNKKLLSALSWKPKYDVSEGITKLIEEGYFINE